MIRAAVILLLLTGAAEARPSRFCQFGFGQIPHGICVLEQIRRDGYGLPRRHHHISNQPLRKER